jgi:DNA-binding FadR family transcriptional regulator
MIAVMSDNKGSTPGFRPRSLERRPVPRDRSEDVAHAIGLRIVAGNPPPGSLLPTEHQLAAEIGVSRAALREGFRLLAARGMIIGRRKVGTMVRPMADWNMLDASVLAWHLEQEPTAAFIDGLFEARLIVEPAAAAMAAQRAKPDDINVMRPRVRRGSGKPTTSTKPSAPTCGSTRRSCRPPATIFSRPSAL